MTYNITLRTGTINNRIIEINGRPVSYVIPSPFGNCQNFSIRHFESLVDKITDLTKLRQILIDIKLKIGKPLVVVDIKRDCYMKIRKHVTFTSKMFYTSSNNSQMVMCIIDTRK